MNKHESSIQMLDYLDEKGKDAKGHITIPLMSRFHQLMQRNILIPELKL